MISDNYADRKLGKRDMGMTCNKGPLLCGHVACAATIPLLECSTNLNSHTVYVVLNIDQCLEYNKITKLTEGF